MSGGFDADPCSGAVHEGRESARGALNVEWDSQSAILNARVVTRGSRKPSPIVGDFVNYLLAKHGTRVQTITTAYR